MTPSPLSISDSTAISTGGVVARQGFAYQDHVAASFCLQMLLDDPRIEEVRCESEDDIALLLTHPPGHVEYVQVKGGLPDQLWSRAMLERKEGQHSLLEHSLLCDRFTEQPMFRIVTVRDVKGELRVLRQRREQRSEKECAELYDSLTDASKKLVSTGGRTAQYWVAHAFWDVRGTEEAVLDRNMALVDQIAERYDYFLTRSKRQTVYDAVLRLVYDSARSLDPASKRITQPLMQETVVTALIDASYGAGTATAMNLIRKMREASISATLINAAIDLRRQYLGALARGGYAGEPSLVEITAEVQCILSDLLAQLESGLLDSPGPDFHVLCIQRVDDLRREQGETLIPRFVVRGAMYEVTNRCSHRFDKEHDVSDN